MKPARALVLALALLVGAPAALVLPGCAAPVQAPTYAQSLAQGYTTLTAVRRLLIGMVQRDRVPIEEAVRIRDALMQVEVTLDLLSGHPSPEGMASVQRALADLERQLMEAQQ